MTGKATRLSVPAAARAMAIFEIFARERRELSNAELAQSLAIPETSCLDLLGTLYQIGYIGKTVGTKRYYPTGRLPAVASGLLVDDPLQEAAVRASETLVALTGESAGFMILDEKSARQLFFKEGTYPLRVVLEKEDENEFHSTATGKALLGALPSEERRRRLREKPLTKITRATKTDLDALEAEIVRHQKLGWYISTEEGREGINSLAVSGTVHGVLSAVNIVGPTARLEAAREPYLKALLKVKSTFMMEGIRNQPEDRRCASSSG